MKNLVMVIHTSMQNDLADRLRSLPQVKGFTFSEVQGHGAHDYKDAFLSARDKVVGFTPHMRVDILLADEDVMPVLEDVRSAMKHARNQGIYWIAPVEASGRL